MDKSITPEVLDQIAACYSSLQGFNYNASEFAFQRMIPYFRGTSCLEVGCSDGAQTQWLLDYFRSITALDGSRVQIERLRQAIAASKDPRVSRITTLVGLAEDYQDLGLGYDTVIASYVLEHVEEPRRFLTALKSHLYRPESRLLVVVPNGGSLHRRIAQKAGLIQNLTDFSEQDIHDGHRRTYLVNTLKHDLEQAGLMVYDIVGILLKPVEAGRLPDVYAKVGLQSLYDVGCDPCLTPYCSSLLAIAGNY